MDSGINARVLRWLENWLLSDDQTKISNCHGGPLKRPSEDPFRGSFSAVSTPILISKNRLKMLDEVFKINPRFLYMFVSSWGKPGSKKCVPFLQNAMQCCEQNSRQ